MVIETATGAVRAMWSYPSYDPNVIADPDYDAAFAALTELQADPRDPLLANAYQQRYMPGSVFKVFTTSVALDDGVVTLESFFPDESQYVPPQTTDPVENYDGSTCGGDLATVFARSCNTPFARIGGRSRTGALHRRGGTRWGFERADPDRPPPPRCQHHRRHVEPRSEPAAARDPRLRAERGPAGADPHGDGRGGRRQRRRDDEAVRGRRRARPPEPSARSAPNRRRGRRRSRRVPRPS